MSNSELIQDNSEVTLHFTIYLADGSVSDSTKVNDQPAILPMGQGFVSDLFEENLLGMKAGEKKIFILPAEEAAGMPNPDNLHVLPRAKFSDELALEKGLILSFDHPSGQELLGIVREFNDETVTVDFNHPLAGQELTVEVDILEVKQEDCEEEAN